jgi:hypothetical protein
MRIGRRTIGRLAVGSVLTFFALTAAGCSWLRLWPDRHVVRSQPPQFSREDAIILARLEAKSKGIQIEPYDISAKQKKESWWVYFQKTPPPKTGFKRAASWPYRFAITISAAGEVDLIKRL